MGSPSPSEVPKTMDSTSHHLAVVKLGATPGPEDSWLTMRYSLALSCLHFNFLRLQKIRIIAICMSFLFKTILNGLCGSFNHCSQISSLLYQLIIIIIFDASLLFGKPALLLQGMTVTESCVYMINSCFFTSP